MHNQALEYTQSEDNSHNEMYHEVAQKPSIHQQMNIMHNSNWWRQKQIKQQITLLDLDN